MKCFKHFKSIILTAVLAFCCGSTWAEDQVLVIDHSKLTNPCTTTSVTYGTYQWSADGISGVFNGASVKDATRLQFNYKATETAKYRDRQAVYNTVAVPGNIKSIKMVTESGTERTWTAYVSKDALTPENFSNATSLGEKKITTSGTTFTVEGEGYSYFYLNYTVGNASYIKEIVVTYGEGGGTVTPPEPDNHIYASLADLVAAGAPTAEGYDVTVTLTNEPIKSIYVTSKGYRNGIYLDGGSHDVEIFCYDVPEDWVKGGTVSGTLTCPWKLYNTTWELCPTSWNDLTYTAPTDQPGGGDEGGNTPEGDNVSWDLSKASYAAASDEQVTWTNAVATMVADKAEAGTNANNYLGGGVNAQGNNITSTRFYKNSKLTITPAKGYTITAIVYDATSDGYATALATSTWTNATATANNKTVTITPTKGDEAISATLGGPTGASKITLYYTTSGTTVGLISNESTTTASPIYNLQGQRISRAQKGVNVVNGKKVIR